MQLSILSAEVQEILKVAWQVLRPRIKCLRTVHMQFKLELSVNRQFSRFTHIFSKQPLKNVTCVLDN
jgi:hypothetical protein